MPKQQTDASEARLWLNATVANMCERVDGKARVHFVKRDDGIFQFQEEQERIEQDGPHKGEPYWTPIHTSGFYESLENAEIEALNSIPWLKENILAKK